MCEGCRGTYSGEFTCGALLIFLVMEIEKAIRRALKMRGADTDDRKGGKVELPGPEHMKLPKGASRLNIQELISCQYYRFEDIVLT